MKSVITILLLSLLAACSGGRSGNTLLLERIDSLTSVNPAEAAALLDSIDPATLSEEERHHRDLLTIKAADKAYRTHTSDSLILSVIDYYNTHSDPRLTPQALYYGGRVYSDLGDYPTALSYFQDALNRLPDNDENRQLRGTVMSQTGRLLDALQLHSDAIPYIKDAIKANKIKPDSFNCTYNHLLLSGVFMRSGKPDSANIYINEALKWAESLPEVDQADINVEYADVLFSNGKIDSALTVIRPLPQLVQPDVRNFSLIVAAKIYKAAGILDTAYMYAHELAMSKDYNNRKNGFKMLFSPSMRNIIPHDSLINYIKEYHHVVDKYLNQHEAQAALIQNTRYNYNLHVKEKENAERSLYNMAIWSLIIIVLSTVAIAILINKRLKNAKQIMELQKLINVIDEKRINNLNNNNDSGKQSSPSLSDDEPKTSGAKHFNDPAMMELKQKLLNSIKSLESGDSESPSVSDEILQSKVYKNLLSSLNKKKMIPEQSPVWEELESLIEKISPEFKTNLQVLTSDNLTEVDLRTALLMRCGFTTSQMAVLLNRTKTAISSRRSYLSSKIFSENSTSKAIDRIIHRI
ncbi:MAG: hypothetical protein NC421_06565 [Lachnospiraceae bacterium]|nr:hypothetical protein [Lachnospiraceae bacterium]